MTKTSNHFTELINYPLINMMK